MDFPSQSAEDQTGDRPTSGSNGTWWIWLFVLIAATFAGVGSWLVGEGVLRAYRPSLMPPMKPIPTLEDSRLILVARIASGTAAFAAMGGLFGLVGGLLGGWRRSAGSAAWASGVGLLGGAAAVAGVSSVILPIIYAQLDPQSSDLVYPLLGHEAIWSMSGAAFGLAFGLGARSKTGWWKTAFGGLLGAGLATVVYEFAGALGFPTHRTRLPLAGSPETRAMAQILVAIGAAIGSVMATAEPKNKTASP